MNTDQFLHLLRRFEQDAANGQTYESLGSHVRTVLVQDVSLNVLDIEGLLKTKTDYREKDVIDKQVLRRIAQGLNPQD